MWCLYQRCREELAATNLASCLTPQLSRACKTRLRWRSVDTRRLTIPLSRLASANCCWCSAACATSARPQSSTSSSRKPSETFRSTGCLSTSINPPICEPNSPDSSCTLTSFFQADSNVNCLYLDINARSNKLLSNTRVLVGFMWDTYSGMNYPGLGIRPTRIPVSLYKLYSEKNDHYRGVNSRDNRTHICHYNTYKLTTVH